MMKRILAALTALGLAATLLTAGPAAAATCGAKQKRVVNPTVTPTGSTVYRSPATPGPTTRGGYIGVTGSTGFIEVGGDEKNGAYVAGKAKGQPVDGKITLGGKPGNHACVAEHKIF